MIDDLQIKTEERKYRSRWFYRGLTVALISISVFLIAELHTILLPIVMGAMLAYVFRPVKKWFLIRWIPHELAVFFAFGAAVCVISGAIMKAKQMVPDEKGKLELKVRLKYKLNERYEQLFSKANPALAVVQKEVQPLMTTMNDWLTLSDAETDLFLKYRAGFKGLEPISDRYYDYFKKSLKQGLKESELKPANEDSSKEAAGGGMLEALSIWILTPLMFIFLVFDNGQIRVSMISLVPNRYFEMTLTMVDELDEAIGAYLRGTFLECALVGGTLGLGLILFGFPVPVALFVAVISGLANGIPFLGPAIGLVIAMAYALIAEDTTPLIPGLTQEGLPIYVAILVGITHVLDNVVYSPIVLGGAVNLHPMVVILAITGGSILLGFWGMLLAIPTVVIFKTGLETLLKELKAYRII